MSSLLEDKIDEYLLCYLKKYDLSFQREVQAGFGSRYDFYIPTKTPIVLEIQGIQHYKPNEYFFKTVEAFEGYKANDNLKKMQHYSGKIYLIEIENDLTFDEFERIMDEYDFILKEGDFSDEEEKTKVKKTYEKRDYGRDYKEAQKERARNFRKEQYRKFKEQKRSN